MTLKRKLGLSTVLAVVMGDMIGSGIFFTPGELAAVATAEWQVYFFWALCGFITLCGALTLAELASLLPRAGVAYHALTEGFGPFAGFMQAWIMVLVSGPGAIAGVAILFGEFGSDALGWQVENAPLYLAATGIGLFAIINIRGVEWGGGAQIVVTAVKVTGLLALVAGALFLAEPVAGTTEVGVILVDFPGMRGHRIRRGALKGLADLGLAQGIELAEPFTRFGNLNRLRPEAIATVSTLSHHDPQRALQIVAPLLRDSETRTMRGAMDAIVDIGEPDGVQELELLVTRLQHPVHKEEARAALDRLRKKISG